MSVKLNGKAEVFKERDTFPQRVDGSLVVATAMRVGSQVASCYGQLLGVTAWARLNQCQILQ